MFVPQKHAGKVLQAGALAGLALSLVPEKIAVRGDFKSHGNDRLTHPLPKLRGDRNAPCACGSTKKFKKCCGAAPKYDAPKTLAEQPQAA